MAAERGGGRGGRNGRTPQAAARVAMAEIYHITRCNKLEIN